MKNINLDELKKIQLDVLQAIHEFCIEENIKYSLGCGSMLGMIRHRGYIPWDDDIDIYLLRTDYDKLISKFPVKYKEIYDIDSLERNPHCERAYAKAYDTRTIVEEKAEYKCKIGVNIDIYPIDKVPDDFDEWKRYNRMRRFIQRLYELKVIKINKSRKFYKTIVILLGKLLLLPISRRCLAGFINSFAQKYNNTDSNKVFECVQGMLQKRPFEHSLFEKLKLMPFEDRIFCGFEDYDKYLSNAYGNYMKLPPLEKRVAHHDFIAYWITQNK